MERRPKSPVSLFFVTPEPPPPKQAPRSTFTGDGVSVLSGSSHGSSTIKASRANIFTGIRFPRPKTNEDRDKKKSRDPHSDATSTSSGGRSTHGTMFSSRAALEAALKGKGKAKLTTSLVGPEYTHAEEEEHLTPAEEYRLLQQASLRDMPREGPVPFARSIYPAPDSSLAAASSRALQDLMSSRLHDDSSASVSASASPVHRHEPEDHQFLQELQAAAEDTIPAWLTLKSQSSLVTDGALRQSAAVSPVPSSYLSMASEFGDDEDEVSQYPPLVFEAWSDDEDEHEGSSGMEGDGDEQGHQPRASNRYPKGRDRHPRPRHRAQSSISLKATRFNPPPRPIRPPPAIPHPLPISVGEDTSKTPRSDQNSYALMGLRPNIYAYTEGLPSPPPSHMSISPPQPESPLSVSLPTVPHRPSKSAPDKSPWSLPPSLFSDDDAAPQHSHFIPTPYMMSGAYVNFDRGTQGTGETVAETEKHRVALERRVQILEREAREREEKLRGLSHLVDHVPVGHKTAPII